MKMKPIPTLFYCLALVVLLSFGCSKSNNNVVVPSITTGTVLSALTGTSVQTFASLTSNGGGTLTAQGICYSSTNATPTVADLKTSTNIDTANFTSTLTGLSPNTTYYIRAYATNESGTGYGSVVTFKTNTATFAINATVSTFAGTGTNGLVNGAGSVSQFGNPLGVCTDAGGNVYVADFYNNVIRKITPAGVTTTYAGNGTLGYVDGPAATAEFYAPQGVAVDASGNVYVSDMGNNLIRKISTTGVVSTLAGRGYAGYADGTGTSAVFKLPAGLVVDASGNVYVADRGNNMIRMITPAGVVTTLAGSTTAGQIDATGTSAEFNSPGGITMDSNGNLYVADMSNNAIRQVTTAGVVTTLVGSNTQSAILGIPWGLSIDSSGNLFITDSAGRLLELNNKGIIYPLAGISGTYSFANGTNTNALFNSPRGVAVDASGNIYVADYYNNEIRKVTLAITP